MRTLAFLALLAVAAPATAGTRAVYEERDEKRLLTFEIDDPGTFRAGREDQYRLVLGDDAYQVAEVGGQVYVARLTDLAAALKETSSPLLRAFTRTATFLGGTQSNTWVHLGRRTVNGWRGSEYRQQEIGHTLEEHEQEDAFAHDDDTLLVVSNDPALEPLGDAMLRYTAEELYLKRHFVSGTTYKSVLRDLDEVARLGTVIASNEGDIRLLTVEDSEIDPQRLELPAAPMTRAEIVALIRAKQNPFKL